MPPTQLAAAANLTTIEPTCQCDGEALRGERHRSEPDVDAGRWPELGRNVEPAMRKRDG
jgi:hypothetical protein